MCASLPPRALPHRFEGSAPGRGRYLSRPPPAPLFVLRHPTGMETSPVLRGDRVTLRPVRDDDAGALLALLTEPAVAEWWQEWDAARVGELIADREEPALAIEAGGELVGVLLLGEEAYPMYRHASLDIAIATEHQGTGLGPEALRLGDRVPDRGARPPSLHDRPVGRQRARDQGLRAARLQARRRDAPLRAPRRRRVARRPAHGPARRRALVASRRPWTGKPRGSSKDSRTRSRARRGPSCSTTCTTRRAAASTSCARPWRRTGSCCCRSSACSPVTRPTASARSPRRSGLELERLVEFRRALGLAVPDPDAEVLGEVDLETREGRGGDRGGRLLDGGHARGHARARPRHGALRRGAARAVRPDVPGARRLRARARAPARERRRASCCRSRAACSTTSSSCTCASCCATT